MFSISPERDTSSFGQHESQANLSASNSDDSSDENSQGGPSKKRKRLPKISCELCKARKVKCDRAEPACGWCARNNRVCVYKERKKPGLKASYGIEIEDKLSRIEASLYLLGRRFEEHVAGANYSDGPPATYSGELRPDLPPSQHSYDARPGHSPTKTASWLLAPPTGATSATLSRAAEQNSSQAPGIETNRPSAPENATPTTTANSLTGLGELPPHDLLYSLVDMYFKHVNTWSPILDRKATFDSLFSNTHLAEPELILLHAIVAVTLRFCKDSRLSPESRRAYHNVSKQKVQLFAIENPSVVALKALALLTVDVLGSSDGPQGWNLLALLVRNVVQLGLNIEKCFYLAQSSINSIDDRIEAFSLPQPTSWIEDEGRRRLFWLTYILDRYATVATSFDFTLDERETDRALPCRYDLFSKNEPVETRWFKSLQSNEASIDAPENLGSFSYHCEILRIMSQIHTFLRMPVYIDSVGDVQRWQDRYRELDSELNTWLSHLPGEYGKISQLCHSDPGSRVSNWIMIHAAFVTAVIRLHSVAAYPTSSSHIFMPSSNAVQRCLAAVDSLKAIAQDVIDTAMLDLLGPPFAFSVWVAGRTLLVHAATMDCPVDPKIWFLISVLESMGQYWDTARNWAGILTRLVREGHQADDDNRQGRVVSSGKTYTEMRRCAQDLSVLVARRPRTVLDPPATRLVSVNDLEYLHVFEWFCYPRLPPTIMSRSTINQNNTSSIHTNGFGSGFAVADPENDWLVFKQPYEFKPPHE